MKSIEIILELLEKNKITQYQLTKDCDLKHGSIYQWKKNKTKPSTDALIKIADYFNVSIDYLLGRNDNTSFTKDTNETKLPKEIINNWEKLNDTQKEMIINMISTFVFQFKHK